MANSSLAAQKNRRGFGASLVLALDIVKGSLRLLRLHLILVVPLLPIFVMVLGVQFGLLFVKSLILGLILVFVVAYCLMFSFAISSHMLQQIHDGQKPSLLAAISSWRLVRMIPKVFLVSLVWYAIVLVIVVIEIAINTLLSRSEQAKGVVNAIFGTVADALRLMGFMLIPIMMFEDTGLLQGVKRLKSTLKDSPITALGGLALTKIATSLIFLIVVGVFRVIDFVNIGPAMLMIGFAVLGVCWVLTMYLEQIFVTGLYLYTTFPQSPLVKILLEEHIGRELPWVPVPEAAGQPTAS